MYLFPQPQQFEYGTTSHLLILLLVWFVNLGLPAAIIGLWIAKPRKRNVWWLALTFFAATVFFGIVFVIPVRGGNYPGDRWGLTITFIITACLSISACLAVALELLRTDIESKGYREWTVWLLGFPFGLWMFGVLQSNMQVNAPRAAVYRTMCKNNLKQIGLALHNFSEHFQTLPDAAVTQIGSPEGFITVPPHSWRVAVLNYLDQTALYRKYDQRSAWDSPQNLPIASQAIERYICPSVPRHLQRDSFDRYYSAYAVLVGPTTAFPNSRGLRPKDFPDGLSNTALVVEACGQQIVWTEPRDVKLNDNNIGVNQPGDQPDHSDGSWSSYHVQGAHTLLADGSVRFVSSSTDARVLKAITTASGGESETLD